MSAPAPPHADTRHEVANLRTLRRLVACFRPLWRGAALVFLLLLLRSGLEIAYPRLVADIVDHLVGRTGSGGALPAGYLLQVGLLAAVVVVRALAFLASGVQAARVGMDVENGLRSRLFARLMKLRFTYHDANRSGATIVRALRDMEKTRHFFREVWFGYLEITLLVIAVFAACFATHVAYGLVLLATFGPGIAGSVAVGRRVAHLDKRVSADYDEVTTVLQENVAGARVVRAFGRESQEVRRFGTRMDALSTSWTDLERYWTGTLVLLHHLFNLSVPLVLAVGVWRVTTGAGGIGEVTAVVLYCRTVHHRLRPLTRLIILGQQATASASRVFEVLDETDVVAPPATPRVLPASGGRLEIQDVHFAYAGGPPVLRGVSLEVPAGGSLGLIGPTGAGKSTLALLLPRFYDPDRGAIRLDGIDLRDLDVHALRAAVGLVFQEAFLFSGTVAGNVAYGRPGIGREEIGRCIRLAAAEAFVSALPQGLDTVVGERGVSLSGGQRQRLTIARALAMDPRVLVFDDATASVDAVTEKRLFEGMRAAAAGRTTLVISQRVTSVRWCDRIAVLDHGVVTAVGAHAQLLERSPLYREIHEHQRLQGATP
jgi:ATP-binding cassette subfamily B protein